MKIFEWDKKKNKQNNKKHGISFAKAQEAFDDPNRIVYEDTNHSTKYEKRYYCLGIIGNKVCTVRFTYRVTNIRIFDAGF